jgi:hypothetical protein
MSEPAWVIHLPTTLTDPAAARDLVAALRDSLGHVTVLDFGEVTLSEEDSQSRRHRVYCDQLLPDRRRCLRSAWHSGDCTPTSGARD